MSKLMELAHNDIRCIWLMPNMKVIDSNTVQLFILNSKYAFWGIALLLPCLKGRLCILRSCAITIYLQAVCLKTCFF